ncbi:methyl-accepting chemotaxis protein [Acetonema longum]|uniref:Methyl-accepting chemotaxis sensory transducer n=1 Tax=Acetonema longum DSM 6540 TaxID=1009370 RepID=F7NFE3_9FIRM|nr:methyl-accepting chemotaxis protein [Acetonema longum]EGO65268.1 methyl-accepting chemotaxis sensory transducer [Acetonema longum DSM 6540]
MSFKHSIQFRLTSLIGALIFVTLLIVSGSSFYVSNTHLTASQNKLEDAIADGAITNIQKQIDTAITQLEGISRFDQVRSGDLARIQPVLKEALDHFSNFNNIYFARADGNGINARGNALNVSDREYFKKVVALQASYVSDIFFSDTLNKQAVTFCVPVFRGRQLIGAVFGTYALDHMDALINGITFKEKGYGVLIEGSGQYIIHPRNPERNGNMNIRTGEISAELQRKAGTAPKLAAEFVNGFQEAADKNIKMHVQYSSLSSGEEQFGLFAPIDLPGGQRWVLLLTTTAADAKSEMNTFTRLLLGLSVSALAAGLILTFFFGRSFVKPIVKINQVAQTIAGGNLKRIERTIDDKGEIGQLADSIILMNVNLRNLVGNVQSQSSQLAAASEELTAGAQQSAEAASQVANSIAQIAQNTDHQAVSANQIMKIAERIQEEVDQGAAIADRVSQAAMDTSKAAEEGRSVVATSLTKMQEIGQNTAVTQGLIADLSKSSRYISEMIQLISAIAGQTNLLALNAAIEAARAGEQGRGFAVVAEEVRKLAAESNAAAQKIAVLVAENESNLTQVVAATTAGAEGIDAGIALSNQTGEAFEAIVAAVLGLSTQIKDVSAAMQTVADGNKTLTESIKEIDATSQTVAGEAETVSAATEEQSASMQQISSSSQSLAALANELQAAVAKFQV